MKTLLTKGLVCLLICNLFTPSALASNSSSTSYDVINDDEVIAIQVGLGLLVGAGVWYIVKATKKSNAKKKENKLKKEKKTKLTLHLDMTPQERSLTSPVVDVDYRVGFSVRF